MAVVLPTEVVANPGSSDAAVYMCVLPRVLKCALFIDRLAIATPVRFCRLAKSLRAF